MIVPIVMGGWWGPAHPVRRRRLVNVAAIVRVSSLVFFMGLLYQFLGLVCMCGSGILEVSRMFLSKLELLCFGCSVGVRVSRVSQGG